MKVWWFSGHDFPVRSVSAHEETNQTRRRGDFAEDRGENYVDIEWEGRGPLGPEVDPSLAESRGGRTSPERGKGPREGKPARQRNAQRGV